MFSNFDQNRNVSKILTTMGIFRKYRPKNSTPFFFYAIFQKFNENLISGKFRPISKFHENFKQNQHFSQISTKVEIFKIFQQNFLQITTNFAIFENFCQNQDFSKISRFFKNFDHSWDFFNISIKVGIFGNIRPKSRFWQFLTKTRFVENFDQNRHYLQISTKMDFCFTISTKRAIFENLDHQNRDLSIILTKIEIFLTFRPKSRFLNISTKIVIFLEISKKSSWSTILSENRDFQKFQPKSRFLYISTKMEIFAKLDQNRDSLQISTKIERFEIFD